MVSILTTAGSASAFSTEQHYAQALLGIDAFCDILDAALILVRLHYRQPRRVGRAYLAIRAATPSSSPAQRIGSFLLQFLVVGVFGWWLAERHPSIIENVGAAITEHTLVSAVIGSLAATTLLVLFVYMAFTLILLPLAIVELVAEFQVVLYGQAVFGYLIGLGLPIDSDGVATLAGIATFLLALELFGFVPYLGGIVQLAVAVVGVGAVLNTYFSLQRFDPITIPGGP